MEYLLILVLTVAGTPTHYVIDTGMTAEDCADVVRANPQAVLYCEADASTEPQEDESNIPTAADIIRV